MGAASGVPLLPFTRFRPRPRLDEATPSVDEETVDRLDALRTEDGSYDEIVDELVNIYQAEELTLFHSGDG